MTDPDRPESETRDQQAWKWSDPPPAGSGNRPRGHTPVPLAAERIRGNRPAHF
jgi:hypothetical protein